MLCLGGARKQWQIHEIRWGLSRLINRSIRSNGHHVWESAHINENRREVFVGVSSILHSLKVVNGILQIHAINLRGWRMAWEKHFSHMLSTCNASCKIMWYHWIKRDWSMVEIGQASWRAGDVIALWLDGLDLTVIASEDACELI